MMQLKQADPFDDATLRAKFIHETFVAHITCIAARGSLQLGTLLKDS